MSDQRHVTSFEDHAKRASVDVPGSVRETLPFDAGDRLGVRDEDDAVVVVPEPAYRGARAVLRGTDSGLRLYVDRTAAHEAGLLDGSVALAPLDDGLRVEAAEA